MLHQINILHIEDSPIDSALIKGMLELDEQQRFTLENAKSFAEACQLFIRNKYSLILCDLNLPDIMGRDTVINLQEFAKSTPIIILTANDDEAFSREMVQLGVQDYLVKGHFNSDLLKRVIYYAIERFEVLKKLERKQVQLAHAGRLISLGEMSAGLAHELNNPLQIIRSAIDLIEVTFREPDCDDDEIQLMIDRIKKHVTRASNIINNMRMFVRQGNIGETHTVNLREAILQAMNFMRQRLYQHNIDYREELAPKPWPVKAHTQRFEQVVINLVSNAFHAIESKVYQRGEPRQLTITLQNIRQLPAYMTQSDSKQDAWVLMEVSNNGSPMSEEQQMNCFEPFYTTRTEGIGLGLSIASSLIRDFNGIIDVCARDDLTVFGVALSAIGQTD